jgi:hypothetical protein
MTKRQRAKIFHDTPEEYLELPMGNKKKKTDVRRGIEV